VKQRYVLIVMLISSFFTFGAEISNKNIKIIVDRDDLSFNIYSRYNKLWTPLLSENSGQPVWIDFKAGNSVFHLNQPNIPFTRKINYGKDYIVSTWENNHFKIKHEISLANSSKDGFYGLTGIFTITNKQPGSISAGLTLLLDTYLGEKGSHFYTGDYEGIIRKENAFFRPRIPVTWISGDKNTDKPVLFGYIYNNDRNTDKIIFANYERLKQRLDSFEINNKRDFSQLPFSINDSGVAYFFYPKELNPGESVSYNYSLGEYHSMNSRIRNEKNRDHEAVISEILRNDGTGESINTEEEIQRLNKFIENTNLILNKQTYTNREISELNETLLRLSNRKKIYEQQ